MEPVSEKLIRDLLRKHQPHPEQCDLVDAGSYDVNGTVRPIATGLGFRSYTGCDARPGPNVDHVVPEVGDWGLGERWHVVVTANTMEHTRRPWLFFEQCLSLLRPGGLFIIVAPWNWKIHRHPLDCWRILPDGLDALIEDHGLVRLECDTHEKLTFMAARKPEAKPLTEMFDALGNLVDPKTTQEDWDDITGKDHTDEITPAFLEHVEFRLETEGRMCPTYCLGRIEVYCDDPKGWNPKMLRWTLNTSGGRFEGIQFAPETREDVRNLIDRVSRLKPTGRLAEPTPRDPNSPCRCRKCIEGRGETIDGRPTVQVRYIVCQVCGNKRCPHANDHENACTNSNAPGQPGSAYP